MHNIRTMHSGLSAALARDAPRLVLRWKPYTWYEVTISDWLDAYRLSGTQPAWEYFERAERPRTISYGGEAIELWEPSR